MRYFLVALVLLCVASLGTLGASIAGGGPQPEFFYAGCALSALVPLAFLYYRRDLETYYRSYYRYIKLGFVAWFAGVAVLVAVVITYRSERLYYYFNQEEDPGQDTEFPDRGEQSADGGPTISWKAWMVLVMLFIVLGTLIVSNQIDKRNSLLKVVSKEEVTDALVDRPPGEAGDPLLPPKRKVVFFPHYHTSGESFETFKGIVPHNERVIFSTLNQIMETTLPALEEGKTVVFGIEKTTREAGEDNARETFTASEIFEIRQLLERWPADDKNVKIFASLPKREQELLYRAWKIEPSVLMKKMAAVDPALTGKIKIVGGARGVIPELESVQDEIERLNQKYIGADNWVDAIHYASNVIDLDWDDELLEAGGEYFNIPRRARNRETIERFWSEVSPYVNEVREVAMLSNMEREVAKYGDNPDYSFAFTFGNAHDFYRYRNIYDFDLVVSEPLEDLANTKEEFQSRDELVSDTRKVQNKARLSIPGQRVIQEEMDRIKDEFRKRTKDEKIYGWDSEGKAYILYLKTDTAIQDTLDDLMKARFLLKKFLSEDAKKIMEKEGFSERAQEAQVQDRLKSKGQV